MRDVLHKFAIFLLIKSVLNIPISRVYARHAYHERVLETQEKLENVYASDIEIVRTKKNNNNLKQDFPNFSEISELLRYNKKEAFFKLITNLKIEDLFNFPEYMRKLYFLISLYDKSLVDFFVSFEQSAWEKQFQNIFTLDYKIFLICQSNFSLLDSFALTFPKRCILTFSQNSNKMKCEPFIFPKTLFEFKAIASASSETMPESFQISFFSSKTNIRKLFPKFTLLNSSKKGTQLQNPKTLKCLQIIEEGNLKFNIIEHACDPSSKNQRFLLAKRAKRLQK